MRLDEISTDSAFLLRWWGIFYNFKDVYEPIEFSYEFYKSNKNVYGLYNLLEDNILPTITMIDRVLDIEDELYSDLETIESINEFKKYKKSLLQMKRYIMSLRS